MYRIIDEHNDFLVVSKHRSVCVHSEPSEEGLLVRLRADLDLDSIYPVHRLDKVTSGLLICAKTQTAASELSQLFQERKIDKYYLALSHQKPKKKQGLIKGDMTRARRGAWKLCQTMDNPAVTQFFSYSLRMGALRLYLLKPRTGKTHQLRVALKSIGAPIIGDRLYGSSLPIPTGILLHAFALCFKYQGKQYQYLDRPQGWSDIELSGDEKDDLDVILETQIQELDRPWEQPWPVIK